MMLSKDAYLDLIYDEPYKIGHWLGFTDLVPLHNEWIRSFLFSDIDETLLAHRGSYKTTCLSIAIALMIIIYPSKTIIFLRKTDTDVIEIIKQVAKILRSDVIGEMIMAIYGYELEFVTESGSEINTNLSTSSRGTSQLIGIGIGASLTGKHSDIVITDDIVNLKDRISKAERERTKSAYMELQNVKNRGGRFVNTGTPWHKEDAITTMPNVKKYSCHQTNLIAKDELQHLRDVMTPSLFAANYELQHIANEDAMFSNPVYTSDSSLIFDGLSQIDASYGGSDGTAFTIAKERDGKLYVFGKRWDKHVDDCIHEVMRIRKELRSGTLYLETNADKGYLAKSFKNKGVPVSEYHESDNKFVKISTYLRSKWKDIIFIEGTDMEYVNEILDYTENAGHDDSPDSLASLIRQSTKGVWLY